MLKLAKTDITPPGGWHFQQPDGPMIRGGTLNDLILNVLKYRTERMLQVEGLGREIEEWICRETNAKCKALQPAALSPHEITVGEAWRFLKTIGIWLKKRKTESQEEADRRSERCAGCRFQSEPPVHCWGCSQLLQLIFDAIGDRRTRFDSQLKFCGICGCNNKIQAWAPMDVLRAYGPAEPFKNLDTDGRGTPCWKAEGLE